MDDDNKSNRNSPKIETAVVSLLVLRIGNKQVTQSVFKQFEERYHHEGDGSVIWGWINYHPSECSYYSSYHHVHFVFLKDNSLFRSTETNSERAEAIKEKYPQLFIAV